MADGRKLKNKLKNLKRALALEAEKSGQLEADLEKLQRKAKKLKERASKAEAATKKVKNKAAGLREVMALMEVEIGNANAARTAANEKAEALEENARSSEQQLERLKQQLASGVSSTVVEKTGNADAMAKPSSTGVAKAQRSAWKRHQYLQDRFEAHVEAGMDQAKARRAANDDLRAKFGDDAGYSEEQLEGILMQ